MESLFNLAYEAVVRHIKTGYIKRRLRGQLSPSLSVQITKRLFDELSPPCHDCHRTDKILLVNKYPHRPSVNLCANCYPMINKLPFRSQWQKVQVKENCLSLHMDEYYTDFYIEGYHLSCRNESGPGDMDSDTEDTTLNIIWDTCPTGMIGTIYKLYVPLISRHSIHLFKLKLVWDVSRLSDYIEQTLSINLCRERSIDALIDLPFYRPARTDLT